MGWERYERPLLVSSGYSAGIHQEGLRKTTKNMAQEMNQSFKNKHELIEQDPLFEKFLDELIGIVQP